MKNRLLSLFAGIGKRLAQLSSRDARDPHDVASTIREVCEAAYRRGGWRALIVAGIAECADVFWSGAGTRFRTRRLEVTAGPVRSTRESSRSVARIFLDDLRHAFRRVQSRPGSFIGAAAMLALAIGVTAAMFTVMDSLILRPVPFRDADRLVRVERTLGKRFMMTSTPALIRTWRGSPAFEGVYGMLQDPTTIEGGSEPVTRGGARISPGLIEMLGVRPILGRTFVDGEGRAGSDDRVMLSEVVWRNQFGADPRIIGRRITLGTTSAEVVGVMPAEFHFPFWDVSLWRPIDFDAPNPEFVSDPARPWARVTQLWAYARLSGSMPADVAARVASDAMHRADASSAEQGVRFRPLAANFLDDYSTRALTALAIGVGLVFLALCANVTSLVLTRMTSRARELAVCAALGAARVRLLREALIENVTLGVVGSAGGLAVGALLVALARHYLPAAFLSSTLHPVQIDLRAVGATSAAGLLATLLAGLAPAWLGTRVDRATTMHLRERGGTASRAERVFSRSLLAAEMALAVALLVGAGLLLRSFVNLSRADRGLDAGGVVTGWISLPAHSFPDRPSRNTYAETLEATLRSMPGIAELTMPYGMPPGAAETYFGNAKSDLPDAPELRVVMGSSSVDNDFFHLFRMRLIDGRLFLPTDTRSDAIIGEQLAKTLWPGTSALGHTFTVNGANPTRIVGVVNEIRSPSSDPREDRPEIYFPLHVSVDGQPQTRAVGSGNIHFAYRCGPICPDAALVRQRIRSVNPRAVIARYGPIEDEFMNGLARPRAAAALAVAFAVVATLVAAGGIFSVLSYAVVRRIREFGIRAAMGAQPSSLGQLVLMDAARLGGTGFALGILAAWMLSRSLTALAFGVTGADPLTWTAVLGVLTATLLAAAWRPALHAMRADPVRLLRDE
jgi:predicted permease